MTGDSADIAAAAREWRTHGFAILPGFVPGPELAPGLGELPGMFPTAEGFHDGTDARRRRFVGDEFAGIDTFPFRGTQLSLLAVSDRVLGLAERFLGESDIRISSAEAWAKYTGAADYDQHMHRDYLNHTLMTPADEPRFGVLELFVYLTDVPAELGATGLLSRTRTPDLPAKPNWYPRRDIGDGEGGWVATSGRPGLYDDEVRAAGPAGTIVAWAPGTFHRGTQLSYPRGARYTLHLSFRPARAEWSQRIGWAGRSHEPAWYRFVARATPRQLAVFGFPPPGHPYWTEATITGVTQRYPDLDVTPWRDALPTR